MIPQRFVPLIQAAALVGLAVVAYLYDGSITGGTVVALGFAAFVVVRRLRRSGSRG